MTYKYNIRKKAMKFIEKQEIQQRKRILKSIYSLPVTGDIKKLAGNDNLYRLRVGDYRILFLLSPENDKITLVDVTNAGNRGQIYNDV
ncbi:MAG: type II toxin-antitoxin system RelE/ParE family toxin [Oscillospiraceae bacterium]|nr:type II toxin-antitoxin system RelE/ParE family toxin [Oscillospiraceae bacterium]